MPRIRIARSTKALLFILSGLMVYNVFVFKYNQTIEANYPDPIRIIYNSTFKPNHDPGNEVKSSVHDSYENAWILGVNKELGYVQVQTVESKITLVFKPPQVVLTRFKPPNITPITFSCAKTAKGECDFSVPYLIYAGNTLVEGVRWQFFNKGTENKITKIYVVSGPGDGYFPNGLVLSVVQIVKDRISGREKEITGSIGLKFTSGSIPRPIKKVKRGDRILPELFNFYELNPYKANLMGMDMNIVGLSILKNS